MTHVNISDFEVGKNYTGVYICKTHASKVSKNNKQYIDMQIIDKTGEINGKCWDIPIGFNPDEIQDGYFIALIMTIEEYNGKPQAKITNLRHIRPEDNFDKSEIIPIAPEPADTMFDELIQTANGMINADLKKLCLTILNENKEELLVCPGAKTMHHAVVSGLLQHLTGMLRLGKTMVDLYPSVNKDLLLAGIMLHDICKLREFSLGPVGICTDYSKEGKLIGHITMGASYIESKSKELGIDDEVRLLMMHMLLSHHGEPDFGSAVRPMFIEAILLNVIDNIDAKVYMCEEALRNVDDNSFSEKVFGLDNIQLYKHTLNKK